MTTATLMCSTPPKVTDDVRQPPERRFHGVETPSVEGKTWARILVKQSREAPAPFRYKGHYYLITSGTSGWAPNAATYAVAANILGPYT